MSLYYGETRKNRVVLPEEFGIEGRFPKKNNAGITTARILLTIAEIGLALIPGIGLSTEIAIGLTAGAINEALDFKSGNASVAGTILNFLPTAIAGGAVARVNAKAVKASVEGAETLLKVDSKLAKLGFKTEKEIAPFLAKTGKISTKELDKIKDISRATFGSILDRKNIINKGTRALENNLLETLDYTRKEIRDVLRTLQYSKKSLQTGSDALIKAFKSQKSILKKVGFSTKESDDIIKIFQKKSLTQAEQYSAVLGYIRNIDVTTSSPKGLKVFKEGLERGEVLLNEAYQLPIAREFTQLSNKAFPSKALTKTQRSTFSQRLYKALKNPGSKDFNDYFVQPIQALFDANDAGRAPIEFLYRHVKKFLRKQFSKIGKIAKKAQEVEELFVQTGGIIVDSDWHLGYKVIESLPGRSLIMISFRNGKLPVFVWASEVDLGTYILSPGRTYLRKWAYSRGGKAIGLGSLFGGAPFKSLTTISKQALTFLNIPALKNILSLTSNIVENSASMVKGTWDKGVLNERTGKYEGGWLDKAVGSFTRTGINRSFRLLGKEIIGNGLVGSFVSKNFGNFIGRELQRFGTNVIAPMARKHLTNVQRVAKGLKPLKPTSSKTTGLRIAKGFLMGAQSNVRKVLRTSRGTGSVINQSLAVRRKFQQVNRIPNAVVPGRPYKGARIKKRR